ncbi:MAG: porin family protein [Betaproteobacteria bacterium]|nr:porin family protein [Betaproteobacteria bacterium]
MKKLLVGIVALGVLSVGSVAAMAADMPVKAVYKAPVAAPIFNWTGFYVGGDVGYIWSRSTSFDPDFGGFSAHPAPKGGVFGLHAGYQYQLSNGVVLGVEGNFAWISATATDRYFTTAGGNTGNDAELKLKWNAAALASLGYAMGPWLPYVTGGAAWMNLSGCDHVPAAAACFPGTDFSGTQSGWTVGGGLAYAVTNNIIARIEYLYADYGSKNYSTPAFPVNGITTNTLRTNTVRSGLSWKFNL